MASNDSEMVSRFKAAADRGDAEAQGRGGLVRVGPRLWRPKAPGQFANRAGRLSGNQKED
jgi:hypothetical protein